MQTLRCTGPRTCAWLALIRQRAWCVLLAPTRLVAWCVLLAPTRQVAWCASLEKATATLPADIDVAAHRCRPARRRAVEMDMLPPAIVEPNETELPIDVQNARRTSSGARRSIVPAGYPPDPVSIERWVGRC